MTIRFILGGAFERSEPELTAQIKRMYVAMPHVFAKLLPQSEKRPEDDGDALALSSDPRHGSPSGIQRLKQDYCQKTLELPVRGSEIKGEFRSQLIKAFA